jgi:hypothetical protein
MELGVITIPYFKYDNQEFNFLVSFKIYKLSLRKLDVVSD